MLLRQRCFPLLWAALASEALAPSSRSPRQQPATRDGSSDVVIIGSGIGGLCAGALLEKLGYSVTVCESHSEIGGCAHGFLRKTRQGVFHFDSGPSLFSGCARPKSKNPLRQVLDAVGADVDWKEYDEWAMYFDGGDQEEEDKETPRRPFFRTKCGDAEAFGAELAKFGGEAEEEYWRRLMRTNANLGHVVGALPPIALRPDLLGALATVSPFLGRLDALKLFLFGVVDLPFKSLDPAGPFSKVLEAADVPTTSLCYKWWDFLAFAVSGLPVRETSAAACSFMLDELFDDGATMDYPVGGTQAIADALAAKCGTVLRNAHVEEILLEDDDDDDDDRDKGKGKGKGKTPLPKKATGVRLRDGSLRRANVAVVSNAGVWQTAKLLPTREKLNLHLNGTNLDDSKVPLCPSFLHLHVGFAADPLKDAEWNHTVHHVVVNDWSHPVDAEDNLVFISAPSVLDPKAAPEGYHVLHAYLPATEPYDRWVGLTKREYEALKEERAEVLWDAADRVVPGIKKRAVVAMVGSPLTHERFTRRYKGTYGPAWKAGKDTFPGTTSPVPRLFCCGDSCFPGIGVPAVAGSAMAAAFTIASVPAHQRLLREMIANDVL